MNSLKKSTNTLLKRMPEARLSRRLNAAFLLVEGGKRLADIGTDHALLPIALVKKGKVPFAIASDINPQPLEKARENIAREGLSDRIETRLTNGARGLENSAEEFVIAGMGGELIADIISSSEFLKNNSIHLVLQPMTKIPILRRWLWDNGFCIEREVYLEDVGHFYTVLSSRYTGQKYLYSELDAEIGTVENRSDISLAECMALQGEIKLKLFDLDNKIHGKKLAGIDTSAEESLRLSLCDVFNSLKGNDI